MYSKGDFGCFDQLGRGNRRRTSVRNSADKGIDFGVKTLSWGRWQLCKPTGERAPVKYAALSFGIERGRH